MTKQIKEKGVARVAKAKSAPVAKKEIATPKKKVISKKAVVKKKSKEELTKEFHKVHALLKEAKKSGDKESIKKYNEEMNKILALKK